MPSKDSYLLRTQSQILNFRIKYADFIKQYYERYYEWFTKNFPLMEWKPLVLSNDSQAEAVIGIICLLYIDKRISISVKLDKFGTILFQRQPVDEEEWKQYMKENGWHGKGLDRD